MIIGILLIIQELKPLLIQENELIVKAGRISQEMYFIDSGFVEVSTWDQDPSKGKLFSYQLPLTPKNNRFTRLWLVRSCVSFVHFIKS